jgi:hypothetical protein
LAKASEQFKQSDVTSWAVVALATGAFAVFSANVSAIVPRSFLANLHKTNVSGTSLQDLQAEVADLRVETNSLKRATNVLDARFTLAEQTATASKQRIGALEVSIPLLAESNGQGLIDLGLTTASIPQASEFTFEAEGGTVTVRRESLEKPSIPAIAAETQPVPPPLPTKVASVAIPTTILAPPKPTQYGVSLGPVIAENEVEAAWRELSIKLGSTLFGLTPLLVDDPNSDGKRVIVGPISKLAEATALCVRLERNSISCLPAPYTGVEFVH